MKFIGILVGLLFCVVTVMYLFNIDTLNMNMTPQRFAITLIVIAIVVGSNITTAIVSWNAGVDSERRHSRWIAERYPIPENHRG